MLKERVRKQVQNRLIEFKEPEDLNLQLLFNQKPKEFLKYLRKKYKNIMTSERWDQLEKESYDKGFTVSKVANADLLEDILAYIIQGRESGATFQDFVKEIDANKLVERMQEAGWTGKSPSRLKVIYETNLQVAYSKEKFKQQAAVVDVLPYLGYEQIERKTKRHDHTKYHKKAFPANDPIWKKIYPPSGFGCKCMTISLDADDAKELGFDVVNPKDYTPEDPQLSLIEQWTPDLKKYNKGIANQLGSFLDKRKTINNNELNDRVNSVIDDLPKLISKKDVAKLKKQLKDATQFDQLPLIVQDAIQQLEKNKVPAINKEIDDIKKQIEELKAKRDKLNG